jgi:kinesin family protein 1
MTSDPKVRQLGHVDSQKPVAIRLSGETILEEHCYFDNKDGKVMLYAMPDSVTVRGVPSISVTGQDLT